MKEPESISPIFIIGFIIAISLVSIILIQEIQIQGLQYENSMLLNKISNLEISNLVKSNNQMIATKNEISAKNDQIKILKDRLIGQKKYTIFLGDSIISEGNWSDLFPEEVVSNYGISGDTTIGVLNRIDDVISEKADRINLMIGINDLLHRGNVSAIVTQYASILTVLNKKSPKTKIYVFSILPVNQSLYGTHNHQVVELNTKIQQLSKNFSNTQYVDIYSYFVDDIGELQANLSYDGLHPNNQGYIVWKKIIQSINTTNVS